ncbi:hypothetical protein BDP81DRAFT_419474 [Colletotrichum phormii]|uniref:Secreted protein n=1 Tax=Colletotrichum phormii TaxID=359342 RepID=A0AAI9ZYF6_9PEZI|nr:uncharacterized protein BDP81DRAFT_419474 [Colletotrichum phormii]KAK1640161.1 hypothetical protein BDP81DRAFT_419474 [Colletotrichum phormii]
MCFFLKFLTRTAVSIVGLYVYCLGHDNGFGLKVVCVGVEVNKNFKLSNGWVYKLVAKPEKRRGKALWAEESDDGPPLEERVRSTYCVRTEEGKPCREKTDRKRQKEW